MSNIIYYEFPTPEYGFNDVEVFLDVLSIKFRCVYEDKNAEEITLEFAFTGIHYFKFVSDFEWDVESGINSQILYMVENSNLIATCNRKNKPLTHYKMWLRDHGFYEIVAGVCNLNCVTAL